MTAVQTKTIARLRMENEGLSMENRELAIVVDSVREIVRCGWIHRQEPCPFCRGIFNHQAHCYLNSKAGAQVVAECEEIERQRDFLLIQVRRAQGVGLNGTPVKRSLKSRLRGDQPALRDTTL